jgi:ribulose-phosphate 3-epimerase
LNREGGDRSRYCGGVPGPAYRNSPLSRPGWVIVPSHLLVQCEPSSTIHLHRVLSRVRELGAKAGVVLDPASPISFAEHVLHLCDIVLVMTVNPGFGGQRFLPEMLPKISQLRRLCEARGLNPWIEVDGGQNGENVGEVVAGSAIFKSPDYAAAISMLRRNAGRADAVNA